MIDLDPPFVLCKTSTPAIHVNLEKYYNTDNYHMMNRVSQLVTLYQCLNTMFPKVSSSQKINQSCTLKNKKLSSLPFTLCVSDLHLTQRIQIKLNTLWAAYKCIKCQQLGVLYKPYCINCMFKINCDWIFPSIYLWRVAIWLKGHWRCHNEKGIPFQVNCSPWQSSGSEPVS